MEIHHKPKPVHSWREFLVELGTITLGVLIALGAEQAVEWIHWRDKAANAQTQLQPELHEALRWSVERVMVDDCINHQLDTLEQQILASGDRWTPVAPFGTAGMQKGDIMAVPGRLWNSIVWDAAVADTSVTHFDPDRLTTYATIYNYVKTSREGNEREGESVHRLNILSQPVTLTADRKSELIELIEVERRVNRGATLNASRLLDAKTWQKIGLDPAQARAEVVKQSTTYAACQTAPG